MTLRKLMVASAAATAVALPLLASAESNLDIAAPTTASASARLDFQIVIPNFIFFQVGPGGVGNIGVVNFDLGTDNVQPGAGGAPMPGTAGSGAVAVTLITNAANVRIAANNGDNAGVLAEIGGGADTIPLADITATNPGAITVPAFNTDTGLTIGGGSLADTWNFSYANTALVAAGTYGGNGFGGRVTYTATDI
jgi:hypothetical protein